MNTKEYISSGILEAYVIGELTDTEREAVEKNIAAYPELKHELTLIEEAQEKLLMQYAIMPNERVKESLLKKIDAHGPEAKSVLMTPAMVEINIWKYVAAASITIAIISTYFAYNYRTKWQRTENDLSELIAQNQQVAQDYNVVNQRLDKIENDIKVIDNPAFKRIIMKGTENAPSAMAYVYWNESSKDVYLSLQSMKELSKENQYQLWAIIDGKPTDVGVIDGNIAGLQKMKAVALKASAFAVTIEPRGGKPAPSLETMQVIGNVI